MVIRHKRDYGTEYWATQRPDPFRYPTPRLRHKLQTHCEQVTVAGAGAASGLAL